MFGLLFLHACGQDVDIGQLQGEIHALQQKVDDLEQREEVRIEKEENIDISKMQSRLESIEDRLTKAELAIATLQEAGLTKAEYVFYDPRGTKLSKTNLQDAMTELENRLDEFESEVLDGNLGEAGPGLYKVGHEEIKRQLEQERREREMGMNGPSNQGGPPGGGQHGGGEPLPGGAGG